MIDMIDMIDIWRTCTQPSIRMNAHSCLIGHAKSGPGRLGVARMGRAVRPIGIWRVGRRSRFVATHQHQRVYTSGRKTF